MLASQPCYISMRKTIPRQAAANIGLRMTLLDMPVDMARKAVQGRDLTDEPNARLRPLVERAIAKAGGQVQLEAAIGWSQSAISGFKGGRQGTSYSVAQRVCAYLGEDYAQTLGLSPHPSVEAIHPVIERVATARAFDRAIAVEASRARGLAGTADLTEAEALELLELTRTFLRSAARIGDTVVSDAGADDRGLGEVSGGVGSSKAKKTRRR